MVPSYFTTVLVDVPSKRPSALKEKEIYAYNYDGGRDYCRFSCLLLPSPLSLTKFCIVLCSQFTSCSWLVFWGVCWFMGLFFFGGGWFLLFAFVLFFNLNLTQLITFTKVKNVVKPLKDLYNLPDDSNKGL